MFQKKKKKKVMEVFGGLKIDFYSIIIKYEKTRKK